MEDGQNARAVEAAATPGTPENEAAIEAVYTSAGVAPGTPEA